MAGTDAGSERRRQALLIGNGTYEDAELRDLRAPTGDVEGLGEVLANPAIGGFAVSYALDRDMQEVRMRIELFFKESRPSDLLLLYITGHGFITLDGQLRFATPTTKMDALRATTISSAFVWNSMDECRAGAVVLILDCCHSGAFGPGLAPKGIGSEGIPHDFDTSQARGRAVITACDRLQYALEDPASGSLFTAQVVEGLRTGDADVDQDGCVSVEDLYLYVLGRMKTCGGPLPRRQIDASGNLVIARSPHLRQKRDNGRDEAQSKPIPLRIHHEGVGGVAFVGPRLLASTGADGMVRLWDISHGVRECWHRSHDDRGRPSRGPLAVAACPRAGSLVTAGRDAHARVWDLQGDVRCCVGHRRLRAVDLGLDGQRLATAGDDCVAHVWGVAGGLAQRRIDDAAGLNCVAFSPDGQALARGGDDHLVRVWGLLTDAEDPLQEFSHTEPVWDVAFSPDGKAVASASADRSAVIWRLSGPLTPIPHNWVVWAVAFSPDGNRLATAGKDVSVRLWNVHEGCDVRSLEHDADVWAISFSPDGSLLATASADGSITVWPV